MKRCYPLARRGSRGVGQVSTCYEGLPGGQYLGWGQLQSQGQLLGFPVLPNGSWAWAPVRWTSVDPEGMVEKEGKLDEGKQRVKGLCHDGSLVGHVC